MKKFMMMRLIMIVIIITEIDVVEKPIFSIAKTIEVESMAYIVDDNDESKEKDLTRIEINPDKRDIKKMNKEKTESKPKKKEKVEIVSEYDEKKVPKNNSFKSYMSYKRITDKTSNQYKLQQQAYTGDNGIRMVDDRYCIAVGTYYTKEVGTKLNVQLKNGTILKCIVGDIKADIHTDSKKWQHAQDGSVIEFIIDKSKLDTIPKKMGDISYCDGFDGEIISISIITKTKFIYVDDLNKEHERV